jgi:signal transduction histidine kinase
LRLEQILNDALEELMLVSEMRHSSIFLIQPENDILRLVAYRNQNEAYLQHFGKGVKVGEQLTGAVAQSGEVIFVDDVDADPRVSGEIRNLFGINTYLGIPLTGSGKVVGVLNLTGEEQRTFNESDLELYRAIGSQVGIAVENAQLYAQAQLVAALEERNRLARDLHDSVTQTLFSITLTAESARAMLVKKPERVEPQLERLQNLARGALAEMRALIFQLRPAALEEQGLVSALVKHIELVRSKENQNINFSVEGERRLSNEHEQALYRITQEALNNVVKHAQATEVNVKLTITDEAAYLTITDNGVGFDTTAVSRRTPQEQKSLGMTSMQERAVLAGGNISINSNPGGGTTISVILPLLSAPRPVGTGIN